MKLVDFNLMRALDNIAIKKFGIKGIVLMENAGRGAADVIKREFGRGKKAAIIVGKGNNGGDGFVCARHLKNSGYDVRVYSLSDIKELDGDAKINALIWKKIGGIYTIRTLKELEKHVLSLRHADVIVDAIFGTGLTKPVSGIYATVIELINKLGKPVISIDIPSGIDAATGKILGCAVKAAVTVTMGLPKLGFFLYPGKTYAGRVEIIDIGIPKEVVNEKNIKWNLIGEDTIRGIVKSREKDTHKGTYGHTLIIGGSVGKTGAAYMAGMGAMRVGSGLVTIALPQSLNPIMEAKTTEVMTYPLPEKGGMLGAFSYNEVEKILKGKSSLVIGPGLGSGDFLDLMAKVIKKSSREKIPVVIDADGLNALKGDLSVLKEAAKNRADIILTPHPGEMARLLKITAKDVQEDRIKSAERLAQLTDCIVILKGAATVVAIKEETFINPTGNPGMATAGTGDILSGMLGGFLSQGMSSKDASIAAVYLHGLSADMIKEKTGEIGMIATDLLKEIPKALNSFIGHF